MSLATDSLCTAEEFLEVGLEGSVELVKGRVISMPPAFPRHGAICANIAFYLQAFVRQHDLGRVMTNDVCIVTKHDPDTVRGADVAYVSYSKVPKGPLPHGYLPAQPELIVEVRSPNDKWKGVYGKVLEYLNADVPVICVIDPETESALVFRPDGQKRFDINEDLIFEDILPGFSVSMRQLFE